MRNIFIIILLFSISLSIEVKFDEMNYYGGLSYATSDNLDAITLNPGGLGVDRGFQFGLGINSEFNDNNKIGIGLKHGTLGLSAMINKNREYDYVVGLGSFIEDASLYIGSSYTYIDSSYTSTKLVKTGFLYRPNLWLSAGLTHEYFLDSKENGLRLATAFRPFRNRITFGFDVFKFDILDENEDVGLTGFLDFKAMNGLHLIVGYNNN